MKNNNTNGIIYVLFFLLVLPSVFIIWKLIDIQYIEGNKWRAKSDSLMIKVVDVKANRGNIYSSDGSLLATSVPKYTIHFDPCSPREDVWVKHITALSESMAKMFPKKSAIEWERYFVKSRALKKRYLPIGKRMNYTDYTKLKTFPIFSLGKNKGGLIVQQENIRQYPMGLIANRTIGYERVADDGTIVRKGIEAAFSDQLKGKNGSRKVQRVFGNIWKPIFDDNDVEPVDGNDIVTTIDVYIQDIAHYALENSLKEFQAMSGCAVVMEVETGKIRAIANLQMNKDSVAREVENYAVLRKMDPGSTFKLASYLAMLDDKKCDTSTIYNAHGGAIRFKGSSKVITDSGKKMNEVSFGRAFELSLNTVITQAVNDAYGANPQQFVDKMESFGFNKKIGIDLQGEPSSTIPIPGTEGWSGIALPWMAYGYGIDISPLQMLTFYNAVANDGKMVKPQFIEEIRDVNRVILKKEVEVLNPKIASKEAIDKMKDLMKKVVERGTAKKIYSPTFSMAGKTGTAQANYSYKQEQKMYYVSSFAGYFPADKPKYSCIVVIYGPKKNSYYGADVAAPVFKRLAQKVFTDMPHLNEVSNINKPIAKTLENYDSYYAKVKSETNTMPNVEGLPLMDALPMIENIGLKTKVVGVGNKVKKQSVLKGHKIEKGQLIILELN